MNEMTWIAQVLHDFTPGAAGIWTGVLMFAGWLAREYRETRKMSAEDRLARREGYAKQVENLQVENRALAHDQRELRKEYDEYRKICQAETDALRQHIISLEFELAGTKRQVANQAIQLYARTTPHPVEEEGVPPVISEKGEDHAD